MSGRNPIGQSDEWYTPVRVFGAMAVRFDVDVAAPVDLTHVVTPADHFITADSLSVPWRGFLCVCSMSPSLTALQVQEESSMRDDQGAVAMADLRDVFERPFESEDDPRIHAARVLTQAEATAVLEYRGDLIAALSQPPVSPAEQVGWRPIETAPKDGTVFMVTGEGYDWPEIVRWEHYDESAKGETGAEGYWSYAEPLLNDVTDYPGDDEWTHWMPLPTPPAEGSGR